MACVGASISVVGVSSASIGRRLVGVFLPASDQQAKQRADDADCPAVMVKISPYCMT